MQALAEVTLGVLERTFHIRTGWPVNSDDDRSKSTAKPKGSSNDKNKPDKVLRTSSTKR